VRGAHRGERCREHVARRLAHLRHQVLLKADHVALRRKHVFELAHRQLVVVLEGLVVRRVLLHCVVRQVHAAVAKVGEREGRARRAHVALGVEVRAAVVRHEHVRADVELAAADEQRVLDVLLHDPRRADGALAVDVLERRVCSSAGA
jgi:hypothetical protein